MDLVERYEAELAQAPDDAAAEQVRQEFLVELREAVVRAYRHALIEKGAFTETGLDSDELQRLEKAVWIDADGQHWGVDPFDEGDPRGTPSVIVSYESAIIPGTDYPDGWAVWEEASKYLHERVSPRLYLEDINAGVAHAGPTAPDPHSMVAQPGKLTRSPLGWPHPFDSADRSKYTARPRPTRNPGRGAMQRATFGEEVEDDGGKGADRYRIFHDKEPRRVVEIHHPFPSKVGLAGNALSVLYRTDKWKKDGDDVDYKHVFDDGVKVYEPWGEQSWLEPAELPREHRQPIALLGQCIGLFLERVDDGEVYEVHLPRARDSWLFAAPDGRMLYVYDPTEGFRAVIAGGRLTVEEEGIDH